MTPRFASFLVGLAALCCSVTVLGDATKPVRVKYWLSPDEQQVALSFAARDQAIGRLYYFNNDASRLCYTFTVSGQWIIDPATGFFSSKDRRHRFGQSADSAHDLGVEQNGNLIEAKIRSFKDDFRDMRKNLPAPQPTTEPTFDVESCNSPTRPSCVKFQATIEVQVQGLKGLQRLKAMIVEAAPGWVFAVTAEDDVALEAVESLSTTSDPGCYWSFIREQVPQLKTR
jgi:hypothetical protein